MEKNKINMETGTKNISYFMKRWADSDREKRLRMISSSVSTLWVNRELIDFLSDIAKNTEPVDEKIFYMQYCRKEILQNERKPHQNHFEAFKEEYLQEFRNIRDEQNANNPLRWIDAELHYLNYLKKKPSTVKVQEEKQKLTTAIGKDWLTFKEMLSWLKVSKSTLDRRIAEGLPRTQIGKRWRYSPKEVKAWMKENED